MLTGEVAVHERADHVVVWYARQVPRGVQAGDGGAGVLVHPHA
nr:hypothetical protein CPGR_02276 [Mycolicibacterium fortuitum subsp. fortuitum DSM 46621 = ATCC 6841 = JCM 6387]